ncbi:MAG: hypothetical protein II343_05355 [Clostridia bacterium]|nr:hypothetical protein [Clostridia bacterium]
MNLRNSSKLDSLIFTLFFCAFHARDHALRDRPAITVGWLRPRGIAVFPAGKTSGVETRITPQRVPRSFRRSETAEVTHKSTQQQSAELRSAGLRSKLKKAEKIRGSSLLESVRFSAIFTQTAAPSPQPPTMHDWFFGTFLTQESTVLPLPALDQFPTIWYTIRINFLKEGHFQ